MLSELEATTGSCGQAVRIDLDRLLAWRADLNSWSRRGTTSLNGTCELLPTADRWLAINLARPDDELLAETVLGKQWRTSVGSARADDTLDRLSDLGVPVAALGEFNGPAVTVRQIGARWPAAQRPTMSQLAVADLSAMWAGPLCAAILGWSNLQVTKIEDVRRPDGARGGSQAFSAWLHDGQQQAVIDFTEPGALRLMIDAADIVVESSRPRAMRQLGILAEEWLAARPGRTWLSITGYGRDSSRVAFGDDAAVAGGLVAWQGGVPAFCADAIADPVTGVYAARAVMASIQAGGGQLIDVSLAGVAADLMRPSDIRPAPHGLRRTADGWLVSHGSESASC